MAKGHGKDAYLTVEDSAGTTLRDIGVYCDNIELERSTALATSTTIGLEDDTFLSGLSGGSLSLAGKWDNAVTSGVDVVLAGNIGNDATVGFEYGPIGNTAGMVKYSGECFVENYKVSSPLEDVVKFSATLKITGAVTRGTF